MRVIYNIFNMTSNNFNIKTKRSRGWAYTLFNYTELEYDMLSSLPTSYHVYAKEICPTTNREHVQGYMFFENARSGSSILKMLPDGAHIEPQGKYSTPKNNRDYIIGPYNKGDKVKPFNESAVEIGDLPVQGTRNDLVEFKDRIMNGMTKREALDEFPNLMACYSKFFHDCRASYMEDKAWSMYESGMKPDVTVLYGPAGCGKTRSVYEAHGRSVYKLEIGDGSSGSIFWNGYDGQDVI